MSGRAIDSSPTEALAGLVERVTFHNAENGFCVLLNCPGFTGERFVQ